MQFCYNKSVESIPHTVIIILTSEDSETSFLNLSNIDANDDNSGGWY